MKNRFNSFDIFCIVEELQKLIGMRISSIYDIDGKTYLIKLSRTGEKSLLLIESGIRLHTTTFEWPKNNAPSGFTMKLRKHLNNKRLESISQFCRDRIVELKFGSGEVEHSIIIELFDRGNILLVDKERSILSVLRPHVEENEIKFAAHAKYPENRGRTPASIDKDSLRSYLEQKNNGQLLSKSLLPHLDYGLPLIEHVLMIEKLNGYKLGKDFDLNNDIQIEKLVKCLEEAEVIISKVKGTKTQGYIILSKDSVLEEEKIYDEFHPFLFNQYSSRNYLEFETFNLAVDDFFSKFESQKQHVSLLKKEQQALKKLNNIKQGYLNKVKFLEEEQKVEIEKAELISRNQKLVDDAILVVRAALAKQIPWNEIRTSINNAAAKGDSVAKRIKELKFETNHISLYLDDPFVSEKQGNSSNNIQPMVVDVDLGLSAFSNATRYYKRKKTASKKQQKTIESETKVIKLAEKRNEETLKKVQTVASIKKLRKIFWFEKFYWFISSENFLVIGGRDQQQNEIIVKRYLKPKDIYVHAEIQGASSIVIKNPSGQNVTPKTLVEAGIAAISYSVAWEAKVVPKAYWVFGDQVSKSAPTGEYLPSGSFMIRGKRNFLPPLNLVLGFGVLFRLDESCIEKHFGERKITTNEEEIILNETVLDDELQEEEQKEIQCVMEKLNDLSMSELCKNQNLEDTEQSYQLIGQQVDILITSRNSDIKKNDIEIETNEKQENGKNCEPNENKTEQKTIKRGQKGKMKKMNEKYKDQDEEERSMRMNILQSAGSAKDSKKNKKKSTSAVPEKKVVKKIQLPNQATSKQLIIESIPEELDIDVINFFTGKPFQDDELLFAVPVVAPYGSLNGYKYKVKLTPGTGRRGKAAKTAHGIFLYDKQATSHEKHLLHAIKDEQFVRNFPTKVKLSGAGMMNLKKK